MTFATLRPSYLTYEDITDSIQRHSVVMIQVGSRKHVPSGTYTVKLADGTVCAVETEGSLVRKVHDRVQLDRMP